MRVLACRAEGWGLRAPARGCEVAPHTVAAAAAPRLFRLWPLSRTPGAAAARCRVGGAARPPSRRDHSRRGPPAPSARAGLGVAGAGPHEQGAGGGEGGRRTLAPEGRGVPQVPPRWAPGGVPRCLSDGRTDAAPVCLPHCGQGRPPARRQAQGPSPPPRWRPRPPWLEAPGVQASPRRRRVGGSAAWGASTAGGSAPGWPLRRAWRAAAGPSRPPWWGDAAEPRRGAGAAPRRVRAKTGCAITWPWSRSLTMADGRTGVGARRSPPLGPLMERARPSGGGPVRQCWQQDGLRTSGGSQRGGGIACPRGPSRRQANKPRRVRLGVWRGAGGSAGGQEAWTEGGKAVSRAAPWLFDLSQTDQERSRNIIRRPQVRDPPHTVACMGCTVHKLLSELQARHWKHHRHDND